MDATQVKTVKIPGFNMGIFRSLLDQTLIVNKNIMIEFTPELVKSCALSASRSFMKLWTIPMPKLVGGADSDENGKVHDLDEEAGEASNLDFLKEMETFNFYIMKGDLFRKYITVHNSELVNLEFELVPASDNRLQAATLTITGKSELGSPLVTKFTLTTEEMITDRVDTYDNLIREVTPSPEMIDVLLSSVQLTEIKRLIKMLHKSSTENTPYITLTIEPEKLRIFDKVFDINIPLNSSMADKITEPITFNILKTDFLMLGNHTFSVYTDAESQKVIFYTKFGEAMIAGLSTKVSENADMSNDDIEGEVNFDDLDDYDLDK